MALLRLAAESGCAGLFIGLESVSEARLGRMRKSLKKIEDLERAIREMMGLGIILLASVVFGFDEDTPSTFDETLAFLKRTRISSAQFNVLTPYPGTRTCRQLKDEKRLLTEDWKYYDHSTVVFRPARMTPAELAWGRLRARREFTTIPNIARQFPRNLGHPVFYWALNLLSRAICKDEIQDYPRLAAELARLEMSDLGSLSAELLCQGPGA